jgi:hypothetical protein
MQFILLPMIHLGTPHFYQAILTRLGSCPFIVAEGVRGKTAAGSLLTLSYRMLGRSRKLGLVAQNLDLDALGVPVIRPDMTGEEFEKRWHQAVPVLHRLLLRLVAPPCSPSGCCCSELAGCSAGILPWTTCRPSSRSAHASRSSTWTS